MILDKTHVRNLLILLIILILGAGFRLAVSVQTSRVANSGYSSYIKSTLNYSNNHQVIGAGEGQWQDGREMFRKLYSFGDRGISYPELWNQLEKSNHPPLYYMLLHTAFGLSRAGEASLSLAFLVNLALSCFTVVFIYLLGYNIFREKSLALFSAFLFAASFLAMEVFVLHKAYELQLSLVILAFLLVFRLFDKESPGMKDFMLYSFVCTLAFLAHYFSYIYIAGICLIIFVHYTWIRRDLKKVFQFAASTLLALAAALLIYPASVRDLFLDFRSREIQEKIANPAILVLNKIQSEVFLFFRWFMTKPFTMIIVSTLVVLTLGLVFRKYRAKPGKLLRNEKFIYLVLYFAVAYVGIIYISPFNSLRYAAPLIGIFILLLAGLPIIFPRGLRNSFLCLFVLHSLLFNTFCFARVARGEIQGGYFIRSWRTGSVLEQVDEGCGIILVSSDPREKLRSFFFHAPPRDISYCEEMIPEELLARNGEILVFIDRKVPRLVNDRCVKFLESRGFESFWRYSGFRVFRRSDSVFQGANDH